jgi:DNA-binding transcriptional MerR regulator
MSMPTNRKVVASLETPSVCALAGMKPQTLDYWARTGLVTPSVRASTGRRIPRLWSIKDVVVVRAIKALRDAGCPLSKVRKVKQLVEQSWGQDLTATVLFWDGSDVLAVRSWGEVESTLARPCQQVLHVVALPLHHWVREAEQRASTQKSPIDPAGERNARAQRQTGA